VLVTGASGFAGSHLLERLAGRHALVAWTRSRRLENLPAIATWERVDLLDRDRVRRRSRRATVRRVSLRGRRPGGAIVA
jgi:nucleoside-diphosphate-sugar epimerase